MDVKVFEYDEQGAEIALGVRDLREIMGDDEEEHDRVANELGRCGRAWTGGGAQGPNILIMRA